VKVDGIDNAAVGAAEHFRSLAAVQQLLNQVELEAT